MKERPILFSGEMVHAILDGRKTVTRRVVKDWTPAMQDGYGDGHHYKDGKWTKTSGKRIRTRSLQEFTKECPYGQPGDMLWVRETHAFEPDRVIWKADKSARYYRRTDPPEFIGEIYFLPSKFEALEWKPSIHMPRWASRITLEVTGVWVERVQDITEEGAKAEGIGGKDTVTVGPLTTPTYRRAFSIYWDNAHVGRWSKKVHAGHEWDKNPWVWVIEFRRVDDSIRAEKKTKGGKNGKP